MKHLFFIIFLFAMNMSFAKKWDSLYINTLIANGNSDKVIDYYKTKYASKNSEPQDVFKIAELYVNKKEYANAIQWYDKEKQLINTSTVNLFHYANINFLTGKYQQAEAAYLLFARLTGDEAKVTDAINLCEKLLKLSEQSDDYKLEKYTYNTSADETNVTVLRTNPIYVSIQNAESKDKNTSHTVYQIVRNFENFAEPVKACKMDSSKLIITSLSYTQDGNTVVFSAKGKTAQLSKNNNEQIYFAENLGGKFLNIKPFPFNTENYIFKNPAFNINGTTILFSSNKTGGFGGFDIWESTLQNGKWTTPKNAGNLLNSTADEINPFVLQDGKNNTLYFSSNRNGGFGGFDIYTAKKINNNWQDVELQEAPINSVSDDISIIYDNAIKTGYFSSNRNGGFGGFDIYRFMPFNLKLKINIADSITHQPIDYALVQLQDNASKAIENITDANGNIVFQIGKDKTFRVMVSKEKYNTNTLTVNSTGKLNYDSLVLNISLSKIISTNTTSTNQIAATEDFIIFTGHVVDSLTKHPIASAKMKMINYATNKLREVDVDATGKFEIKLLLNNNYKVIFENNGIKFTDEISTIGFKKDNVKINDYVLSKSTLKLQANKTYIDGNQLKLEKP